MKKLTSLFIIILFSYTGTQAIDFTNSQRNNNNSEKRKQSIINLQNFFKSYDPVILLAIIKPVVVDPESAANSSNIQYMVDKNRELITILSSLNPVTYDPEYMNPNDDLIVFAGAIELYREQQLNPGNHYANPAECIRDVILGFFDVASLIDDYISLIKNGASWSTARGLIWRTLKRYGGWVAAAGIIYDIVKKCL